MPDTTPRGVPYPLRTDPIDPDGDAPIDAFKALADFIDGDEVNLDTVHATDAEQNVRLWQLEADVLGAAEGMDGWQGDAFLVGQDEVATNTGLAVDRNADIDLGLAGLLAFSIDTWYDRSVSESLNFYDVAHDGVGLWVAVGRGMIYTSPNGHDWTNNTPAGIGTGDYLYAVAYDGSGLWVAVGVDGVGAGIIWSSPDGFTWTEEHSTGNTFNGVAHDGVGLWVAVNNGGDIWTSPDGSTWTEEAVGLAGNLNAVAHDGSGLWVVVGSSGVIQTSPDGSTWTNRATPDTSVVNAIAHDGVGLWVAGAGSAIWTSPDGVTWTNRGAIGAGGSVGAVASDGGTRWLAFGGNLVLESTDDGVSWSTVLEFGTTGRGIAHHGTTGKGRWVVVGNSANLYTNQAGSDDAGTITLTAVTLPATCSAVYLLADKTVDAGVTETCEATLDGGTTWEAVVEGETTTLGHTGTEFALRFTHSRVADSGDESAVRWIIGYAQV